MRNHANGVVAARWRGRPDEQPIEKQLNGVVMFKWILTQVVDVVFMALVVFLAAAATLAYGLRIGW